MQSWLVSNSSSCLSLTSLSATHYMAFKAGRYNTYCTKMKLIYVMTGDCGKLLVTQIMKAASFVLLMAGYTRDGSM